MNWSVLHTKAMLWPVGHVMSSEPSTALGQIKPPLLVRKKKDWHGLRSWEVGQTAGGCSASAVPRSFWSCTNYTGIAWRSFLWAQGWSHGCAAMTCLILAEGGQSGPRQVADLCFWHHARTRTAAGSGLAGHRYSEKHGSLRAPPCPLLSLRALDFIPFDWGRLKS